MLYSHKIASLSGGWQNDTSSPYHPKRPILERTMKDRKAEVRAIIESVFSEAPMANAIDDLSYLLSCLEVHADKFPVPDHIRSAVSRLRASPAPSQHTGWSDEAVEAAAKAIAKAYAAGKAISVHDIAKAGLTAASSIAPATGFEVRALEWNGDFAHTGLGLFYHIDHATGVPGLVILEKIEGSCTTKSAWPDVPSAEAHAQADFDAAIRSTISPSVAKESGEP